MTLQELLANEELRRHEFPVAAERVFLAHAAVCPLPRRVAEAMRQCAENGMHDDQEGSFLTEGLRQTRTLAAQLLGAQPEEIALLGPTSLALSYVAAGLQWRKGRNVLVYFDDYPANVYPWMALAERGVEVRMINVRGLGRIRVKDVIGQVDENTDLVALASCHFVSGWRLEVDAIGRLLQARGIPFCVDGIQTLGALPTSVQHVDYLAADAHKWLLGPCGIGIFYVRKSRQVELRPPVYGWHNVRCPNFIAQERLVLCPDARRYEVGTANLMGIVGLKAALELVLEIGVENIGSELLRKRNWLVPAIMAKGYTVLHHDAPEANTSGVVTFFKPGEDMAALHQKLATHHIVCSLRADRAGQQYLRFTPHFYNTDTELHRALEWL
jgi:selenocysteine lyase/cysteine desulfurase